MSPELLVVLFFVVTLGLCTSAAYFFIVAPINKQKLKVRVTGIPAARRTATTAQTEIMRRAMLSDIPALSQFLAELPGVLRLEFFLHQAAIRMNVASFMVAVAGGAVAGWIAAVTMRMDLVIQIIFSAVGGSAPFMLASYKRECRFRKFEEQFPAAVDLLSRAVRAGHAFTTALSLISQEMTDPVAEEFRTTFNQQNLGLPLRDAFTNMTVRIPLPDVHIFVTAIQIHRESGGNLGEVLDNLATVIRERFRILREVRTITAEARLSMYVLIAMPFCAAILMYAANANYISPLIGDPLGRQMLAFSGVMMLIGVFIIRKIVKIKV